MEAEHQPLKEILETMIFRFHVKGFGGVHLCNYIQMTSAFGCFFTDKKGVSTLQTPRDQLGRHDSHLVTGISVRKRLEPKTPPWKTFSRTSQEKPTFATRWGPVFPSYGWVFVDPLLQLVSARGPWIGIYRHHNFWVAIWTPSLGLATGIDADEKRSPKNYIRTNGGSGL